MRKAITILFILTMMSFFLMACGIQGSKPSMTSIEQKTGDETEAAQRSEEESKPEEKYMVEIVNFSFSPATLRIPAGSKVTWINLDGTFHTVTSDDEIFNSGNLAKGWTFSHTFETEGTYEYHCKPHSYMKGKVIVE